MCMAFHHLCKNKNTHLKTRNSLLVGQVCRLEMGGRLVFPETLVYALFIFMILCHFILQILQKRSPVNRLQNRGRLHSKERSLTVGILGPEPSRIPLRSLHCQSFKHLLKLMEDMSQLETIALQMIGLWKWDPQLLSVRTPPLAITQLPNTRTQ